MLRLSWTGSMTSVHGCRAICWRVLLGLLSFEDRNLWPLQLQQQITDYQALKLQFLPSFDKVVMNNLNAISPFTPILLFQVKADPLSALSTGNQHGEEWDAYYKNIELANFIKGDLDRLYLNGIEEDFFHTPDRRSMLLSILFIWSSSNPSISYRQGYQYYQKYLRYSNVNIYFEISRMHEILGTILYCVEAESSAWASALARKEVSPSHPLAALFQPSSVEAYTYRLFDRVMTELEPIYDPVPTSFHGVENQPFVVQFCMKIQGSVFSHSISD